MLDKIPVYSDIISFNNNKLKPLKNKKQKALKIKIFSNISCFQLKEYISYYLLNKDIIPNINFSNYDDFIDSSEKKNKVPFKIVFWEVSNLFDGAQYKVNNLNNKELNILIKETINKIKNFIRNNSLNSFLIFNRFSILHFNTNNFEKTNLQILCEKLNNFLDSLNLKNFVLVNIDQIISEIGTKEAVSLRDFYNFKSLYNLGFYNRYSKLISNLILSKSGKYKKVLVLDCDNTLWKGILVDDGLESLEMSENSYPGSIFYEAQNIINNLYKRGVILCLCTKNNFEDLKKVFNKKTLLKLEQFAEIKCNWNDKPKNISQISKKLNLGLDSFVFVDDSAYEVNFMKKTHPEVDTFQVPSSSLFDYPNQLKQISNLFFNDLLTEEDKKKNLYYIQEKKRVSLKEKFISEDDYIKTLNIQIVIENNQTKDKQRVTQLTQKTNQFNSSLKRYNENEIDKLIKDNNFDIYTAKVSDK